MKKCLLFSWVILYCGILFAKPVKSGEGEAIRSGAFELFDATLYKEKPDLLRFGIRSIKVIYEGEMWPTEKNAPYPPSPDRISRIVTKLKEAVPLAVIDIEHWPLHGISEPKVVSNLNKYIDVAKLFKRYTVDTKIGYFGVIPIPDYWRAFQSQGKHESLQWRSENSRIASLVDFVDFLCPVVYTFYANRAGWVKYAIAQMKEARRLARGKPVYAFIWPQYHESNKLLGKNFIAADYWRLELETVYKYADGAIIWGGWSSNDSKQHPLRWDDKAEWWQVTKSFLAEINGMSVH